MWGQAIHGGGGRFCFRKAGAAPRRGVLGRLAFVFVAVAASTLSGGAYEITTSKYYDDRRCAVVWSADDLSYWNVYMFGQQADICRSNGIVLTPAIVTGMMITNSVSILNNWPLVQTEINKGNFALASHSVNHPAASATNWNPSVEVGGSQSDICNNLVLPRWNRYRGGQRMTCWIQPNTEMPEPYQSMVRTNLSVYHYLSDRKYRSATGFDYASWDTNLCVFERIWTSGDNTRTLTQLNTIFNNIYTNRLIHHVYNHPVADPATNGSVWVQHMQHIGSRKDVWYVGLEHLYTYRYLQAIEPPAISATSNAWSLTIHSTASRAAREKYALSYPLTYRVQLDGDWEPRVFVGTNDRVMSNMVVRTSGDFFNGDDAYRIEQSMGNTTLVISKAFEEYQDELVFRAVNVKDSDGDGLYDAWERYWFGNLAMGPTQDADLDGQTNLQEQMAETDPNENGDSDEDGLSNGAEQLTYHTNPQIKDTDGDGFDDGWEVTNGLSPLVNNSNVVALVSDYIAAHPEKFSAAALAPTFTAGLSVLPMSNSTVRIGVQFFESSDLRSWAPVGDRMLFESAMTNGSSFYRFQASPGLP